MYLFSEESSKTKTDKVAATLIVDGYAYRTSIRRGSQCYWNCINKDLGCGASLTTNGEVMKMGLSLHNHDPPYNT